MSLDPPDHIPPERFELRIDADCRHGCVLLKKWNFVRTGLVVWDPITGKHRGLPHGNDMRYSAAVLCDAGGDRGHMHSHCNSNPLKVIKLCMLMGVGPQVSTHLGLVYRAIMSL